MILKFGTELTANCAKVLRKERDRKFPPKHSEGFKVY